jgi:hypothetical protein
LTDAGQWEIDGLIAAMQAWLSTELHDWGADDDQLLRDAMADIARQIVDQDPQLGPPRRLSWPRRALVRHFSGMRHDWLAELQQPRDVSPRACSPLQVGKRNSSGSPSGPVMNPAISVSSSGASATTSR